MNTVTVRPIRNRADFDAACSRIGELMDAPDGSPESDELDVLFALAKQWELENDPCPPRGDPIEALEFWMDQKRLTPADLIPAIGSRGRVSEILSRKRTLTLAMIRRLHEQFRIPTDALIGA